MTFRRGHGPDPDDTPAHLSDEDVERRLGGDAGLGGPIAERTAIVAAEPAPPKPPRPPRSGRGGILWRDVGLVLVLLAFLALGARVVLPDSSSATATRTPAGSELAVASPTAAPSPTPTPTPTPTATPIPLSSDVIPSLVPEATPTPVPTPTPTPTPTPAPGSTPKPTSKPTPSPATLVVYFQIAPNDDGGQVTDPSKWTITVKVGTTILSSFLGSNTSTWVSVPAGQKYAVTANTGPGGYLSLYAGDCATSPPSGATEQCTITEDDQPARLRVYMSNPDGADASQVFVALAATNATPVGAVAETTGQVTFSLNAHTSWSVHTTPPSGFVADDSACSGSGLANGALKACTVTVTVVSTALVGGTQSAGFDGPAVIVLAIPPTLPLRRRREATPVPAR